MREEGRGERRESVRKRSFLLASSYSLCYPSGGKYEASSAVFLVVADLVCILSSRQLAAAGV